MSTEVACSICGCGEFKEYNTRPAACCTNCGSLERTRLLWLIIEKLQIVRPGMRVLHWAPEKTIAERLMAVSDISYRACDIDVEKYRRFPVPVEALDMCEDLPQLPDAGFDLIIHNHVLEHIPCRVDDALAHLGRITAPDGHLLFSVPFRGQHTDEDLSPELTDEERNSRFGQSDHMRIFGRADFIPLIEKVYGTSNLSYDMNDVLTNQEVAMAGVPARVLKGITGETIFRYHQKA